MITIYGSVISYLIVTQCLCAIFYGPALGSTVTVRPGKSPTRPTSTVGSRFEIVNRTARPKVTTKLHHSNISKTYADIIKTYDRKFRPFYSEQPVNVTIDCHVLSFGDINEVEMEYSLDIYFLQLWHDPRFNITDPLYHNATVELIGSQINDVWVPDTIFVNSKRSKFHSITIDNRFLTIYLADGMMVYHSRITMTAACTMDLRSYPFDMQSCKLAIESYGHDEGQVVYKWRQTPDCGNTCNDVHIYDRDMSNFDVMKAVKSKEKTNYHAVSFSSATTRFVFKRRQQYFIFRIFIPSILIVMVSWSTFWISQDAVPARAGICITTILTLITMLGVVNTNMPKVSYMKAIDLFLLVSFIFVFCSLVEYIFVLNFENYCVTVKKEKNAKNNSKDDCHIVKDTGSCVVTVKAESKNSNGGSPDLYGFQTHRQRKIPPGLDQLNDSLSNSKAYKKLRKINMDEWKAPAKRPPTHIIDKVSRILFPLSYGIFNFTYWWIALNSK